jgi:hypothetical protein
VEEALVLPELSTPMVELEFHLTSLVPQFLGLVVEVLTVVQEEREVAAQALEVQEP